MFTFGGVCDHILGMYHPSWGWLCTLRKIHQSFSETILLNFWPHSLFCHHHHAGCKTFFTPIAPVTVLVTALATAVPLIPPLSSKLYTGFAIIHVDSTKLYTGFAIIDPDTICTLLPLYHVWLLRLLYGDEFGEKDSNNYSELSMVLLLMIRGRFWWWWRW